MKKDKKRNIAIILINIINIIKKMISILTYHLSTYYIFLTLYTHQNSSIHNRETDLPDISI